MAFSSFSICWVPPLSARLRLGRACFTSLAPNVVQVSAHRIIKGPCYPCELEALLYVRQHTTIPVPRVHRTYPASDGRIYIEMELVKGVSLAELWLQTGLADDAKTAIMADLHDAVAQLRSLPPPAQQDMVASASTQAGVSDGRIGPETYGPFASHDTFHTFLRGGIPLASTQKTYGDAVFQAHARHYKTHFTHADLVPRNIIIRNDRIAAIVDWGFAGWYPEYWEYTKIHFDAFVRPDWYKAVKEAIPPYDAELAAERALWQQYDEPGVARR
ncbi:Protein kinase-like domain protein [Niveomyces insectorum RCEF 264]|uniref:Protein kinase-like domain protein n=1 Tax=Niveomyces insectorum RCEF 264 TaxID=1081102 RepID=A0A167U3B0_9HYPO|nr:Protein kinase-like domain protein [Niveomyces insectorum RCEF 264]